MLSTEPSRCVRLGVWGSCFHLLGHGMGGRDLRALVLIGDGDMGDGDGRDFVSFLFLSPGSWVEKRDGIGNENLDLSGRRGKGGKGLSVLNDILRCPERSNMLLPWDLYRGPSVADSESSAELGRSDIKDARLFGINVPLNSRVYDIPES